MDLSTKVGLGQDISTTGKLSVNTARAPPSPAMGSPMDSEQQLSQALSNSDGEANDIVRRIDITGASESPGFISGNLIQAPVNVPISHFDSGIVLGNVSQHVSPYFLLTDSRLAQRRLARHYREECRSFCQAT